MSYRLYWRRNDGVSGHVWLSAGDMDALAGEMTLQGMPWPGDRLPEPGSDAVISADEVEETIAAARGDAARRSRMGSCGSTGSSFSRARRRTAVC